MKLSELTGMSFPVFSYFSVSLARRQCNRRQVTFVKDVVFLKSRRMPAVQLKGHFIIVLGEISRVHAVSFSP